MGRRKIEIVRIENERHRQVTFTKRKTGLLKKATELAILCDAQVAVMIFNQNQKLCVYSSAPMEQLMKQYKDYSETPEVRAAASGASQAARQPARQAHDRQEAAERRAMECLPLLALCICVRPRGYARAQELRHRPRPPVPPCHRRLRAEMRIHRKS